jgi:hypothetical protein
MRRRSIPLEGKIWGWCFLHVIAVCVVRIQLQRFLIVCDSQLFFSLFHVGFPQTVVHIPGLRVFGDIELEDCDRLFGLVVPRSL